MSAANANLSEHSYRAAVVEAGAHLRREQHRLIVQIAQLDASNEWAADGAPTCAHWVANALEAELCTAREWVRIGRALDELPEISYVFAAGRLSYSKIRALTRVATAETQEELLALADRVPAGRFRHAVAAWRLRRETPQQTEVRERAATSLTFGDDADGMGIVFLRLPPADMATLHACIDASVRLRGPDASADASGRWPSLACQRADALVELCNRRGDGTDITTEVVLHVRGDGCTMDDGTPVADTVVARIAETSFLRALIHDAEGQPINASGRHRHPTARQRRVVHERDRHCVDCGATDLLEYDHDPPWHRSGHTIVDELHLRCANCHHRRHRESSRLPGDGAG